MTSVDARATSTSRAGESYSVHENYWVREQTSDGRVYFFNRATGASQWHVPNDCYELRDPESVKNSLSNAEAVIRMPAESRAVLNVDCVMEVPGFVSAQERLAKEQMVREKQAAEEARQAEENAPNPLLVRKPLLTMKIISARGLRDTDFMPGKDKSDPYCICEIIGKPASRVVTHVVQDELDPVWDVETKIRGYEEGDIVCFSIWDEDKDNSKLSGRDEVFGGGAERNDDLLGRISIAHEDMVGVKEPIEMQLDESGEGITAFITFWPIIQYQENWVMPERLSSFLAENGGTVAEGYDP